MRRAGPHRSEARLLAFIADEMDKHVGRDGGIQAACAALQRLGFSLVVSVAVAPGDAPPRVIAPRLAEGVPQWNDQDAEILRSLGIAREATPSADGSPSESGRRDPR